MSDTRTPQEIADEAGRILDSLLFKGALERMQQAALAMLLAAHGEDADIVRREMADRLNVLRDLPNRIRGEMETAKQAMKTRGGVA